MRKKLHLPRNQSIGFISLLLLLLLFSCQQRYGYRKKVYVGKHPSEKEKHVEQNIKPADSTTIGLDDILLTETPKPSPAPEMNKEKEESQDIKEENKEIFPPQIKKQNTVTQDSTRQQVPDSETNNSGVFESELLLMIAVFFLLLTILLVLSGSALAALFFIFFVGAALSGASTVAAVSILLAILIASFVLFILSYFIGDRMIRRRYLPEISKSETFSAFLLAIAILIVLFTVLRLAVVFSTLFFLAAIILAIIILAKWKK